MTLAQYSVVNFTICTKPKPKSPKSTQHPSNARCHSISTRKISVIVDYMQEKISQQYNRPSKIKKSVVNLSNEHLGKTSAPKEHQPKNCYC